MKTRYSILIIFICSLLSCNNQIGKAVKQQNKTIDVEDSNHYSQRNYKDNIQSDISLYAGVYEGNIEIPSEGYYFKGFGTIVFYYNGVSLKCLYDGIFLNNVFLRGNIVSAEYSYSGRILGKFVKNNEEGFLHYGLESYTFKNDSNGLPIGDSFFLKKIGDSEMASKIYLDAEKELNKFKDFEILFRKAFVNRNEKKILSMLNLPFYGSWGSDKEYKSKSELKKFIKTILDISLWESSSKNQNNIFEGTYEIGGNNDVFGIILHFKKIGTDFKLVFTTGIAG